MLTSKFLKGIMTEAYPVIKRQVEDAKIVSGFRDTVAANGGDWSALKALIKAHVEDTLDEEGGNKRVQKILDKADSSNAYAGMLGLIMNEKNFIADDDEFDPSTGEIKEPQPTKAAGQAVAAQEPVVTSSVENEAAEISTIPAAVEGQRSTPVDDVGGSGEAIQPETATSFADAGAHGAEADDSDSNAVALVPATNDGSANIGGDHEVPAHSEPVIQYRRPGPHAPDVEQNGSEHQRAEPSETDEAPAGRAADESLALSSKADKPVEASASAAPLYAAPGIVTTEHTPPEPVKWHPYAQCFPTVLGDDLKALERDIHASAGGIQKPIVKIGNLILDGRARYGIARSMLIDYPVVQYDGSDPLIDVIRWNLASRFDRMTSGQIAATAKALCKIEPDRADDIMQAFGIETAEAAE